MHIAIPEYLDLFNQGIFHGTKNDNIGCSSINTGLFSAILEQPTVNWVACGHDHSNDFYGKHQGIYLGYGRTTGYAGYGPYFGMKKGARVFEVSLNPEFKIETWIREEDGYVDRQTKSRKRHPFEEELTACSMILPRTTRIHRFIQNFQKLANASKNRRSGSI